MVVDEKEIDEFIENELTKEKIDQSDKIDENVETHLQEMGWLWDKVQNKLGKDNVCFGCKQDLSLENKDNIHVLEANKVEKGVIAFVSICSACFKKLNKNEVKK